MKIYREKAYKRYIFSWWTIQLDISYYNKIYIHIYACACKSFCFARCTKQRHPQNILHEKGVFRDIYIFCIKKTQILWHDICFISHFLYTITKIFHLISLWYIRSSQYRKIETTFLLLLMLLFFVAFHLNWFF